MNRAVRDLEHVVRIDPDYDYARGNLLHLKMYGGDWHGFSQYESADRPGRAERQENHRTLRLSSDIGIACGSSRLRQDPGRTSPSAAPAGKKSRAPARKSDWVISPANSAPRRRNIWRRVFTKAMTATLSRSSPSTMAQAMAARCAHGWKPRSTNVIPISGFTDRQAAERIRDEEIDMLVNLNGYFGKARIGRVRAPRPPPSRSIIWVFPERWARLIWIISWPTGS